MAAATAAANPQGAANTSQQDNRYPFLWGTQEQRVPVASIPFTASTKAATVRLPKNGYICKLLFQFVGTATVSGAGSAGTASLWNLIQQYILSYNGGFQYRQEDGESVYVMNNIRAAGASDPVLSGPSFVSYNPTSATAQTISLVMEDEIALNTQLNADKYLLAAQARNADITLDIFWNPITAIIANTETLSSVTGNMTVAGLYLLDPDYNYFKMPDLTKVQQIITDASYTAVVVGDNTVPIVPVNGPKYLQLPFKVVTNSTPDPGGNSSVITRVQLRINNGLNRYDMTPQALQQENFRQFGRKLPAGWYVLDFLNDISINNTVSTVGRNVISTEKIANLWLIVTIATGTTVTNSVIKLIKRVELPAIG